MRKIKASFDGLHDTFLFSMREGEFYSYEKERGELHEKYGGIPYYTSQSGLSGAGWLEEDDLVRFGFYHPKHRKQKIETVSSYEEAVFGYVPWTPHNGCDFRYPVVLTDGNTVAFVSPYDVVYALLDWNSIKKQAKMLHLKYFNFGARREDSKEFFLYNIHKFRGVNAARFIDLRYEREQVKEALNDPMYDDSLFPEKLTIAKVDDLWCHVSRDGLFDKAWDEDPRNIIGEIVNEWYHDGDKIYWKREFNSVFAFIEVERSEYEEGRYSIPKTKYANYELYFPAIKWYQDKASCKKELQHYLRRKIKMDYVIHAKRVREKADVVELMAQHPELVLTIKDSLEVGNCELGTMSFIDSYNLKTEMTIGDLLRHKDIDKMLDRMDFKKVILSKIC
jgi:hypothetical protein